MTRSFEIDCGDDEPIVVETVGEGPWRELVFHGWDEDTELAAIELGFKPSPCYRLKLAVEQHGRNALDKALMASVQDNDAELVELLLLAGADPDTQTGRALFYATNWGNSRIVKVLIAYGADINLRPLAIALPEHWGPQEHETWCEIVATLVQAGADVHRNDDIWLTNAALIGDLDIIKLLVEQATPPYASEYGNMDAIRKAQRVALQAGNSVVATYLWDVIWAAYETDDEE